METKDGHHPTGAELNDSLSARERQLLEMATEGLTDNAIAHKLGISLATVSTYWGRVRIKFGPLPRTELVAKFIRAEMERATSALAASEARFRVLLEASPLGIILTDSDGNALYVNGAYERISGRPREELLAHGTLPLVHPDDRERVAAIWSNCLQHGESYTSEHRYLRNDGSMIWVRSKGDAWLQDGKIGGRVGIVEDVTAQLLANRAREAAETRYRSLLSLAPEAIISIDYDQKIIEFNPSAERIFGYSANEAIGLALTDLIPPAFRSAHGDHVRLFGAGTAAAARPMAARAAVFGLRKDGTEFPAEASILRESIDGEPIYTAILRDLTERKSPGPESVS